MQLVLDLAQIRRFFLLLGLVALSVYIITDPESMAQVTRFLKTTILLPTV